MMSLLAAALLVLGPQPAAADPELETMWSESRSFLEPAGIDRRTFRAAFLWTQMQYYLGYCRPYIGDEDFLYWRTWWKGTVLEESDAGRRLLLIGDDQLAAGVRDRRATIPTAELCQRTADAWLRDMKAAVDGR